MTLSPSEQLKPVKTTICFPTVSPGSDSSKAGVCLYLGRFSIFALFPRCAEHYFLSIVLQGPSFISGALLLLSHSLAVPLCYVVTFSLARVCGSRTVTVIPGVGEDTSRSNGLQSSIYLPQILFIHFLRMSPTVPSFLPPFPPSSSSCSSFTPQARRSFLCSQHLFCSVIN